jgi:flagellar motility protein MotE (MotC chaperone)
MENLSAELKGQKEKLRNQADELDQRKARLDAERQELDRIRADLENMRHEIDERVITIKADEMHNLRSLAMTYAKLAPNSAVAILREMDDSTAVKILSLMKPDVTAPIFDTMASTPDGMGGSLASRAAALSEKLRLMKNPSTP